MGIFFNSNIFKTNDEPCYHKSDMNPEKCPPAVSHTTTPTNTPISMEDTHQTLGCYYNYLKNDYLDILKNLKGKVHELSNIKMKALSKEAKADVSYMMEKGLKLLQLQSNMLRNRLVFFKKNIEDLKQNHQEKQRILKNIQKIQIFIDSKRNTSITSSSSSSSSSSSDEGPMKKKHVPIKKKNDLKKTSKHRLSKESSSDSSSSTSSIPKSINSASPSNSNSGENLRIYINNTKKPTKKKLKNKVVHKNKEPSSSSYTSSSSDKEENDGGDHTDRINLLREKVYQDLENLEKLKSEFLHPHPAVSTGKENTMSIKTKLPDKPKQLSGVKIVNYNLPKQDKNDNKNIDVKAFLNPFHK